MPAIKIVKDEQEIEELGPRRRMDRPASTSQNDKLLLPFERATDERESQRELELLLVNHAEPLISKIARRKLQAAPFDAGDVCSEVVIQLLARLRGFKANPDKKPISNFLGYVAVTAYNVCHEHLRQKYPRRYSLRNRLRYLLTHNEAFALWESTGELGCGLARWSNKNNTREGTRRLREMLDSAGAFERSSLAGRDLQRLDLAELVTGVFESIGNPVELDELVNAIAEWSRVKDEISQAGIEDRNFDSADRLADTRVSLDVEVERRIYVQRLWSEICQLPQRQRAALLLNLKDGKGGDCIALFPLSGIATPRDIADLLSIPAERFAEMWNDLPLEDATIAEHLGVTRQQVINLRKSARERLARRMKAFEEGV
ncbi:MAG TPA: sigma-70 family RNA polymerase sigma factor [Blastocatellia bacterium]|nr:sigma-70 family RNA polymerase sigma factor [Blastocatellia bacterium]